MTLNGVMAVICRYYAYNEYFTLES